MSKNQSTKQLKPYIKKLFVEDGWGVPGIAAALNRPPKTIYNWVNKESWEKLREEQNKKSLKTPEILTKALEEQIEKLSAAGGAEAVAQIADSISKISKTIKSLYKEQDRLGSVLFTMADFGAFVRDQAKNKLLPDDFFSSLRELLEAYSTYALQKYSPGISK